MKFTTWFTAPLLILAFSIPGQSQSQGQNLSPGPSKAPLQGSAPSDQELNIRAYIELLRSNLNTIKPDVMTQVMKLNAEEAEKFWPIYRDYSSEMDKTTDRKVALVKKYIGNYENMTDEIADQLANELLKIELERNGIKKKYYELLKKALNAITATRFLQVENQLLMLLDLQGASTLPVIK